MAKTIEPCFLRVCVVCGVSKPLTDFYADKRTANGYSRDCKQCRSAENKRRRNENLDEYRARERERNKQPERAAKIKGYQAKHAEKRRAEKPPRPPRVSTVTPERAEKLKVYRARYNAKKAAEAAERKAE